MTLTLEEYLAGIEDATDRLVAWAEAAGLDAPTVSAPEWTVRRLLAHQGMVHRWATAVLAGDPPRDIDSGSMESAGLAAGEPTQWLREGSSALIETLQAAPEDLAVFTFLKEAPPARLFWARRQFHETSMHALDALSAAEQRMPRAADAWFGPHAAIDGIDELLVGFWPRRGRGPRSTTRLAAVVRAGEEFAWRLDIDDERVVTTRLTSGDDVGGAPVVSGDPVEVYLGLWNRGGRPDDPAGLLARWAQQGAIRW